MVSETLLEPVESVAPKKEDELPEDFVEPDADGKLFGVDLLP